MMKIHLLYAAALLTLVSCKKDLEPQESTGNVDSNAVAAGPAPALAPVVSDPSQQLMPGQVQQPQQQAVATAPGMNPPHGQPGHRCDIAVGAPLSSAPKQSATPAANPGMITVNPPAQAGTSTVVPTPAAATPTAPGMNPPHGQPGHRCDIAVGQPLPKDGEAAKPAATPSAAPAILQAP